MLSQCARDPSRTDQGVVRVAIGRAAYLAAPRLELVVSDTLCGARYACPAEHLVRAAISGSGEVAVLTDRSSIFVMSGARPLRQIVFDNTAIGNLRSEAALEATPDGGWQMLLPGSARFTTVDSTGQWNGSDLIPLSESFYGATAFEGRLVQMILPATPIVGDSVEAEFVGVAPRSISGVTLARIKTVSVRSTKSDLMPLPPFFRPRPVWVPIARDTVLYSDRADYRISWLSRTGPWRELVVDAPLREVTPEELDDVSARFLAQMPKVPFFRSAMTRDVARRRDAAARFHPPISSVLVASDRTILAAGVADPDSGTVRWDLLDPAGALLGYFELGDLDRILWFDDSRIVLFTRDEQERRVVRSLSLRR